MDEQSHAHKLLGLPVIVWIAGAGLLALFIYSHQNSTVSGVTLPSTTQNDLSQSQATAADLANQVQQEALAAKTATDQFNLAAAQATFGQQYSQNAASFATQNAAAQAQQQAQASANALSLQQGAQQLQFNALNQQLGIQTQQQQNAQSAGQYAEQQALEQAQYRNMHQGGFTIGSLVNGLTNLGNSAVSAYKTFTGLNISGKPASTPPFVPEAGIPPQ